MGKWWIGAALIVVAIWYFRVDRPDANMPAQPHYYVAVQQPDGDAETASDRATDEVATQGFEDVGDTGTCTQDCSGHDAGFEWAKEHGLTDPSECAGKSQSFIEGCEAYGQALQERSDEASSDDGDKPSADED